MITRYDKKVYAGLSSSPEDLPGRMKEDICFARVMPGDNWEESPKRIIGVDVTYCDHYRDEDQVLGQWYVQRHLTRLGREGVILPTSRLRGRMNIYYFRHTHRHITYATLCALREPNRDPMSIVAAVRLHDRIKHLGVTYFQCWAYFSKQYRGFRAHELLPRHFWGESEDTATLDVLVMPYVLKENPKNSRNKWFIHETINTHIDWVLRLRDDYEEPPLNSWGYPKEVQTMRHIKTESVLAPSLAEAVRSTPKNHPRRKLNEILDRVEKDSLDAVRTAVEEVRIGMRMWGTGH